MSATATGVSRRHHGRSKSRGESTDSSGMSGGSPSAGQPNKLFIGGLSYDTTDESLERYFQDYGHVESAVVLRDPNTMRSRGFGFVTFATLKAASEVVSYTHHMIDGRKVEAKFAVPRSASNATNSADGNPASGASSSKSRKASFSSASSGGERGGQQTNNVSSSFNNNKSAHGNGRASSVANLANVTNSNNKYSQSTSALRPNSRGGSPQFGATSLPGPYSAAVTGGTQKSRNTCSSPVTLDACSETSELHDEVCDAVSDLSQHLPGSPHSMPYAQVAGHNSNTSQYQQQNMNNGKPRKSSIGSITSIDSLGGTARKARSTSVNSKGKQNCPLTANSRVESKEGGRGMGSSLKTPKTPNSKTSTGAATAVANGENLQNINTANTMSVNSNIFSNPADGPADGTASNNGGSIISNKIFVGGLLYATGHESLRDFFEKYGAVESAEVIYNRDTKKSRGFGFVVFRDYESVDKVLGEQDSEGMHVIDGKQVEVKRCVARQESTNATSGQSPTTMTSSIITSNSSNNASSSNTTMNERQQLQQQRRSSGSTMTVEEEEKDGTTTNRSPRGSSLSVSQHTSNLVPGTNPWTNKPAMRTPIQQRPGKDNLQQQFSSSRGNGAEIHSLGNYMSSPLAALNADSNVCLPEIENRIRSASLAGTSRDDLAMQQLDNLLQQQPHSARASTLSHHSGKPFSTLGDHSGFDLHSSSSNDSMHSLSHFASSDMGHSLRHMQSSSEESRAADAAEENFHRIERTFSTLSSASASMLEPFVGPSSPRSYQGGALDVPQSPFPQSFNEQGGSGHSRRSYSMGGLSLSHDGASTSSQSQQQQQQQRQNLPTISLDTLHLPSSTSSPSFRASSPGPVPDSSGIWSNSNVPALGSPAPRSGDRGHGFRRATSLEVSVPSSPFPSLPSPALARHTSTGGQPTSRSLMPDLEPLSTNFSSSDAFSSLDLDPASSLASTPQPPLTSRTSPLLSPSGASHLEMGPLMSPVSNSHGLDERMMRGGGGSGGSIGSMQPFHHNPHMQPHQYQHNQYYSQYDMGSPHAPLQHPNHLDNRNVYYHPPQQLHQQDYASFQQQQQQPFF